MFEKCGLIWKSNNCKGSEGLFLASGIGSSTELVFARCQKKILPRHRFSSSPPPVRTEDRQIGSKGSILGRDEKEGSSRAQKWSFKDLNCNCECLPCV